MRSTSTATFRVYCPWIRSSRTSSPSPSTSDSTRSTEPLASPCPRPGPTRATMSCDASSKTSSRADRRPPDTGTVRLTAARSPTRHRVGAAGRQARRRSTRRCQAQRPLASPARRTGTAAVRLHQPAGARTSATGAAEAPSELPVKPSQLPPSARGRYRRGRTAGHGSAHPPALGDQRDAHPRRSAQGRLGDPWPLVDRHHWRRLRPRRAGRLTPGARRPQRCPRPVRVTQWWSNHLENGQEPFQIFPNTALTCDFQLSG
jgi:hypothetical protein